MDADAISAQRVTHIAQLLAVTGRVMVDGTVIGSPSVSVKRRRPRLSGSVDDVELSGACSPAVRSDPTGLTKMSAGVTKLAESSSRHAETERSENSKRRIS